MKRLALLLVLLSGSLAGCVDDDNSEAADGTSDPASAEEMAIAEPSHLVDYFMRSTLGTDLVGPWCDSSEELPDQWFMRLEPGARVDANHTELVVNLTLENTFSEIDYTGYRIGAYYDHELVFWSDVYKESTTFTHALDGSMPDLGKDQRWTFSFKRTDPLTEDEPDACTTGHRIQEHIEIQIHAQ